MRRLSVSEKRGVNQLMMKLVQFERDAPLLSAFLKMLLVMEAVFSVNSIAVGDVTWEVLLSLVFLQRIVRRL